MKLIKNASFIISFLAAAGIYFLLGTVAASAANEDYPEQMIRLESSSGLNITPAGNQDNAPLTAKTDERRKRRKMEA
ncbi:hypothetical protein [Bacillus licheniformis]|uniref:hypothetical protein n=1 Tax=Bacillus licheniformis TaxID=1402 RepID=UPI0002E42459|nr:hypothetical protein [Bacillus licheniformis]PDH72237.1 hypothetical protein TY90_10365 [Bacillus licheniformis]TWJ88101.1 hypothetical protein CHCC20495_3058 [Bacillus licheniformis]TWL14915.1 hypothetical protein CHCC19466_0373 [Bacillus licheniformis]TWL67547.1 hypothetical protein CHCC15318_0289 [Bacillus licheniformis]TWL92795.1 hypothetical protein CHCC15291_1360 [Bacillus licheniformis]